MAITVTTLAHITSHEGVFELKDPDARLHAFVAVHSTVRGPGAGGTRFWGYDGPDAALADALRLSEGMSYKNAVAELPLGGGKGVVMKPDGPFDREAVFDAYGRGVEALGGMYITAEDVGVTPGDMAVIARHTKHVAGLDDGAAASGDPSPVTARGVFMGIQACAARAFGRMDLAGKHVAVQGVGHVGAYLCEYLHGAGARLTVCDVDQQALSAVVERFGARVVAPDDIFDVDADVFAPCALGGVLNRDTVERLCVKVVAGGANNQLADPWVGDRLVERGIVYAPDFVINGGGIINVAAEVSGHYDPAWVDSKLKALFDNLNRVLDIALTNGQSTQNVAEEFARSRLVGSPVG